MPKNEIIRYKSAAEFVWRIIKPHKYLYYIASALALISVFTSLFQARLTQRLIDSAAGSGLRGILIVLFLFICLAVINTLIAYFSGVCVSTLSSRAGRGLKEKMAHVLIGAEYSEIIKLEAGDTLQRINSDTATVCTFLEGDLTGLFSQLVIAVGALIYILCISPLLAVVTFAFTPVGMFITLSLNKKMNSLFPVKADSEGRALSVAEQVLSCIPVIKSFMAEKQIRERIAREYEAVYTADLKISKYDALIQPACSMTAMVPRILYLIYAGYMVANGGTSVGVLLSVFDLIGYTIGLTVYFPFILNKLNHSIASINRISKLSQLRQAEIKPPVKSTVPYVRFDAVSFSYENGVNVLSDISFEHKGTGIIAVCGKSGSGKTTLLDILAGLYEPTAGRVEVRGGVAVVTQDSYIFKTSITENVRIAKPDAPENEIQAALKLSGADKIQDTAGLSGGEKQRISLARTFLMDSGVWLLDEPTSALDTETEKIITESIKAFSDRKLIIVAAHRPSLTALAGRRIEL